MGASLYSLVSDWRDVLDFFIFFIFVAVSRFGLAVRR